MSGPRPDARPRLVGETLFTADLKRDGMLWGHVFRSPLPAARIMNVDVSRALAAHGVHAVLTGADIPDVNLGLFVPDEPLVARDRVAYAGEPVALIAAETAEQARQAARLIHVEWDPVQPILTIEEALDDEAVPVRPDKPNVTEESRISRGDVELAFDAADFIVHTETRSHRVHQTYVEPRAALAEFSDSKLIVHTSSQAPFEVRHHLAQLLGMPLNRIVVRVPAIGGGFGGKLHLGLAGYAAVLSGACDRPVMMVASREDEFMSPAPRENSLIRLESAVMADGTITARRGRIYLDCGAYAYDTPPIAAVAVMQGCGPYRVDAIDLAGFAVYTNTVPTGSFRAPSGPQMAYAVEMHMNEVAAAKGIDPCEVRQRNALRSGDLGPTGQAIANDAFSVVLGKGLEALSKWREEDPRLLPGERRGVGLGCAWWTVLAVGGAVTLSMNEDATFTLNTGGVEIGTGAISVALREIVAESLGVEPSGVTVVSGATDSGPYDIGSQGGRTLYGLGTATSRAAEHVRRLLIDDYASSREVAPEDVVLAAGDAHIAGDPNTRASLASICASVMGSSGPIIAQGRFQPEGPAYDASCVTGWVGAFNDPTFHCHVVDLAVNVRTGAIRVNRLLAIHDVGEVVSLSGALGQVEGGVLQGIGYALMEEIVTDGSGHTLNANLHDYHVPTMSDIPSAVEVDLVTGFSSSQSYRGLKGIGEAPVIPVAAAIGSAVRDAVGAQPSQLPMTPERIARLADDALTPGVPR